MSMTSSSSALALLMGSLVQETEIQEEFDVVNHVRDLFHYGGDTSCQTVPDKSNSAVPPKTSLNENVRDFIPKMQSLQIEIPSGVSSVAKDTKSINFAVAAKLGLKNSSTGILGTLVIPPLPTTKEGSGERRRAVEPSLSAHDILCRRLFRHASESALSQHRIRRWEELARAYTLNNKEKENAVEKEQKMEVRSLKGAVTADNLNDIGLSIDSEDDDVIIDRLVEEKAENEVLAADLQAPEVVPEAAGRRSRTGSFMDPLEAMQLAEWWWAISERDLTKIHGMTVNGSDSFIKNWPSCKYQPHLLWPYKAKMELSSETTQAEAGAEETKPLPFSELCKDLTALQIVSSLAYTDCLELLLTLYPKNVNIDMRERHTKKSSILYAAQSGSLSCVQLLHRFGAAMDSKDRSGENILHKAARSDSTELVGWLCQMADKHKIKVNLRSKKMNTPLLLSQSRFVAMHLINIGADPTLRNLQELDIACIASIRGDLELLEVVLLSNTALQRKQAGKKDKSVISPKASRLQPRALSIHTGLLPSYSKDSVAATVGSTDSGGHFSTSSFPKSPISSNEASADSVAAGLSSDIDTGAGKRASKIQIPHNIDIYALRFCSPLHLAVYHGHAKCVDLLCKIFKSAYQNVTSPASAGTTGGAYDDIRRLIMRDNVTVSSIDYVDATTGWTPLQLACVFGNTEVAQQLIRHGAAATAEDSEGANAIVLAAIFGHAHIVKMIPGASYTNHRLEGTLDVYLRLKMRHVPKEKYALLNALTSDNHACFAELVLSGACFSSSLLQRLTPTQNMSIIARTGHSTPAKPTSNNLSDTATTEELLYSFLNQDQKTCDVALLCRSDKYIHRNEKFESDTAEDLTDVFASPNSRFLYAHRAVLEVSSGSAKLAGMLRFVDQQRFEKGQSCKSLLRLELDDLDFTQACQMLNFVYTGRLERSITGASMETKSVVTSAAVDNAEEETVVDTVTWLLQLIPIAEQYIVPHLSNSISEMLVHHVLTTPAMAGIVFVSTVTTTEVGICDEWEYLRLIAARQMLLHFKDNRLAWSISREECIDLLSLALSTFLTPSELPC